MAWSLEPMLAADVDGVIKLILILVFVIGWGIQQLSRLVAKPRPPVAPPRRAGPDRNVQDEIDIFIKSVVQQKQGQPGNRPAAARPARAEEPILSAETATGQTQKPSRPQSPGAARKRKLGTFGERKQLASETQRQGVEQHVAEHIDATALERQVAAHLGHRVEQSVREHLGSATDAQPERPSERSSVDLIRMLRDPDRLRQTIVLNEILGPPRSRSPRRTRIQHEPDDAV